MNNSKFRKQRIVFIFLILFSVLSFSFISAAYEDVKCSDMGMSIALKDIRTIKLQTDYLFQVHVYNETDGQPLSNVSTDCAIHIYNKNGQHLMVNNDISFSPQYDFFVNIAGGNFSTEGSYPYVVACRNNGNGVGGSACEGNFEVTGSGFDNEWISVIIILISLIIIIFGFKIDDGWIVIFGSFGLTFAAFSVLFNGILNLRNQEITLPIALILFGIAGYLGVNSAKEMIQ